MLSNVSFDRPAYGPGETMTVTVTGNWFVNVNGTATSGLDNSSLAASVPVIHPVTFTDEAGRTWTLTSNDGETAVFTAEA